MLHGRTVNLICLLCLGVAGAPNAAANPPDSDAWINLFNGKNLDGWTVKIKGRPVGENPDDNFSVADGLLKVGYPEGYRFAGRFGHLFYDQPFSHYALHLEYRFVGSQAASAPDWANRNSGAMLHAQSVDSMTLDQEFPASIEAQLLGGLSDGKQRPTANVCTPGTDITVDGALYPQHCLYSSSPTIDGEAWVNVTIVVLGGGSITHYVEGKEVLSYQQPRLDNATAHLLSGRPAALQEGYIALQSESAPIDFRRVRLLNLSGCGNPEATNYKPYVVNPRNADCRFDNP